MKHYSSEGGFGAGVMVFAVLVIALAHRDDPSKLAVQIPTPEPQEQCRWRHWPEGGRDENGVTQMKHERICHEKPVEEIGH